ncbi:MAG: TolC family protein [Saprospiraceae bacterium]
MKFIYILLFVAPLFHQESVGQNVLGQKDFLDIVRANHPVAKQAELLNRSYLAERSIARGGFEPKIAGELDNKTFDGKNYYTTGDYALKVPSWYGLEFKAGYKTLSGININPSDIVPDIGQAVLGVSASLVQNLLIDERRATLQKARLLRDLNAAERKAILNELLFEAGKAYWEWTLDYNQIRIFEESVRLAAIRFEGVKQQFFLGDKTAFDTIEAKVLVQDRQFELSEAVLEYQNSGLKLSTFLWDDRSVPLEISDKTLPPNIEDLKTDALNNLNAIITDSKAQIKISHPLIVALDFKIRQLEIDRKLKREKLKPQIDISYNLLGNGLNLSGKDNILLNNYSWGLQVNSPILFRKAKGEVELAQIKIADSKFKQQQKTLELEAKLLAYFNEYSTTVAQIDTYTKVTANYSLVLDGENERFKVGESSMFLLNSRERKVIEARLKLNKLNTTLEKLKLAMEYAKGTLAN